MRPVISYVSRFKANPDRTSFDAEPERVLLQLPQDRPWHHVGQIQFGNDGYLYVGFGDGGHVPPTRVAQDPKQWYGKILPIDVDHPKAGKNYGIPPSNPYVNGVAGDFRFSTPIAGMKVCNKAPLGSTLGVKGAVLLKPGAPDQSLIALRMRRRGPDQMPPLATTVADAFTIRTITEPWIDRADVCNPVGMPTAMASPTTPTTASTLPTPIRRTTTTTATATGATAT